MLSLHTRVPIVKLCVCVRAQLHSYGEDAVSGSAAGASAAGAGGSGSVHSLSAHLHTAGSGRPHRGAGLLDHHAPASHRPALRPPAPVAGSAGKHTTPETPLKDKNKNNPIDSFHSFPQ